MAIKDNIKKYRKQLGLNQPELALRCGWDSQSRIANYESGSRIPKIADLEKIAKALGVNVGDLIESTQDDLTETYQDTEAAKAIKTEQNIHPYKTVSITHTNKLPIVGTAQLGDDGYWAELDYPTGHGDGYIQYPSKDPSAYALRCKGDSMKPRIKQGEYVVIEPSHTPVNGDEVLVKCKKGRVMVKELLYIRDNIVHLGSVNEAHGKLSIDQSEIETIHYVAAIVKNALWVPD